ncbi:Mu homology domain-containing protein [Phakopsora pachyrhizi]|nr:Mu homology domain-containing protein [Phakopsora pachyrhizi]
MVSLFNSLARLITIGSLDQRLAHSLARSIYGIRLTPDSIRSNFLSIHQILNLSYSTPYGKNSSASTLTMVRGIRTAVIGLSSKSIFLILTHSLTLNHLIHKSKQEVFIDINEIVSAVLDGEDESLITADLLGLVEMRSKLSGMPDLLMTLSSSRRGDDRLISFVPPDSNFQLMTFRLPDNSFITNSSSNWISSKLTGDSDQSYQLPIRLRTRISDQEIHTEFQIQVSQTEMVPGQIMDPTAELMVMAVVVVAGGEEERRSRLNGIGRSMEPFRLRIDGTMTKRPVAQTGEIRSLESRKVLEALSGLELTKLD